MRSLLAVLAIAGGSTLWQLYEKWQPRAISFEPPAPALRPRASLSRASFGPTLGPRWPPSDEEWTALFGQAKWVYPLPGPARRAPANSRQIFAPASPKDRPAVCRPSGHCAVDLGGELWGEHVYAAQDGVVDRIQRDGSYGPGGAYVRLAHFGGYVFTQYFHLAGIPRGFGRGSVVKAGDVIGLVGDSGTGHAARHLTFTLSVLPSNDFAETYWDPAPWMADWPLHVPAHGTVAGLAPEKKVELHAGGRLPNFKRRGELRPPLSDR